ncbi:ABC transporter ATP-binding protein [Propionicicella superfundia]|uniref:ABC transporter ATP-binding protein n=1 Tax=Propionicicella superfundia TaxID=348582 RepID=UPI00040E7A1A|nr:ATP-binding cassette domain-containing protein [Propionicicella superfundia]
MIVFDRVSFTYDGAARPTLRDVDLRIGEGDLALVVGRTGTGKSTLLGAMNGLVPHFTGGTLSGAVTVDGRTTSQHRPKDMAEVVGYVGQNPLHGFVTDTVEEEIAYGMEQLGVDPVAMRKRVEETLDLMGIAELRRRPLLDLSGGQQQRVAIASVLAAQPRVLVLDEPTSALDPTAAQDVLAALTTLVHEVGLTIVLAEHRLERVMQAADVAVWVTGDGTVESGPPRSILGRADVVPPLAALAHTLGWDEVPLSVREARRRIARERITVAEVADAPVPDGPPLLSARDLTVSYGDLRAVKGVSLDLAGGTITALMGRNGSGKSSLVNALQGAVKSTGELVVAGDVDPRSLSAAAARRRVTLVPQSAGDLLYLRTVAAECAQADRESLAPAGTCATVLARLDGGVRPDADPRDLSEGQRLSLVLAIQLTAAPPVVLLDEPTRGLDYRMKANLSRIVDGLAADGACVVVVTHDVEFAAAATHRALLMAEGEIVADGTTREVCGSSPAFAPQLAKVFAPQPIMSVREVVVT